MLKLVSLTQTIEQMACRSKLIYRLSKVYYKSIIEREIALAGISSNDHVLCIGGGPCPFSGIMIHELTGAEVTIIDCDSKCTNFAKNIINHLGFSDHIKVVCKNGCDLNDLPFTIIHLAAQLSPLNRIFTRIKENSKAGTKILVRLPRHKYQRLYSPVEDSLFAHCPRTLHNTSKNLESTALYVKTITAKIVRSDTDSRTVCNSFKAV